MEYDYHRYSPSPPLRDIVETIWVQQCATDPLSRPTTVVPTGRVELIFHYGDLFEQTFRNGRKQSMARYHAVGQRQRPIIVGATGTTGIVIVRFAPWGASAVFGDMLPELRERIVDLELIWSRAALARLGEQLRVATSHVERVRLVELFVIAERCDARVDALSRASIETLNRQWGSPRIESLASGFGLGRRQFTRRFTNAVGASPKQLAGVLRAQKAVACLQGGRTAHDVVADCQFADQAHLVREVSQHTGLPPSRLLALQPSRAKRYFNSSDPDTFCGITYL